MDKTGDSGLFFSDKTGALLMLNKEERILIKELLFMSLNSESVKAYISKRLGDDYLQVGQKLFDTMGGSE